MGEIGEWFIDLLAGTDLAAARHLDASQLLTDVIASWDNTPLRIGRKHAPSTPYIANFRAFVTWEIGRKPVHEEERISSISLAGGCVASNGYLLAMRTRHSSQV